MGCVMRAEKENPRVPDLEWAKLCEAMARTQCCFLFPNGGRRGTRRIYCDRMRMAAEIYVAAGGLYGWHVHYIAANGQNVGEPLQAGLGTLREAARDACTYMTYRQLDDVFVVLEK